MDAPILSLTITSLFEEGVYDLVVICDSRGLNNKDREIWSERMGQPYEHIDFGCPPIYEIERKVPFYFVKNHNDENTLEIIETLGVNYLLNAGTPRRVGEKLLNVTKGVVNVHPGVLPEYKGCTVVEWALFNGETVGNTAHFMNAGYDTGPIIEIERYPDLSEASYTTVRREVTLRSARLAARVSRAIAEGRMSFDSARPQHEDDGRYWSPIPPVEMAEMLRRKARG